MDRLFLDANVLFSAAYSPQAHYRTLWELPETELVTSAYSMAEAKRNLDDPVRLRRLDKLAERVKIVPTGPSRTLSVELPEKDRPILQAAINAEATHLMTQDQRHFGQFFGRRVDTVTIMRPDAYLRARRPQNQ